MTDWNTVTQGASQRQGWGPGRVSTAFLPSRRGSPRGWQGKFVGLRPRGPPKGSAQSPKGARAQTHTREKRRGRGLTLLPGQRPGRTKYTQAHGLRPAWGEASGGRVGSGGHWGMGEKSEQLPLLPLPHCRRPLPGGGGNYQHLLCIPHHQHHSAQFSLSRVQLFRPHGLQRTRPPCPSPSPRVHPNSCPLS